MGDQTDIKHTSHAMLLADQSPFSPPPQLDSYHSAMLVCSQWNCLTHSIRLLWLWHHLLLCERHLRKHNDESHFEVVCRYLSRSLFWYIWYCLLSSVNGVFNSIDFKQKVWNLQKRHEQSKQISVEMYLVPMTVTELLAFSSLMQNHISCFSLR